VALCNVLLGGVGHYGREDEDIWGNDGKWDSEWIFIIPPILVEF
jgi:hypothetical protein